MDEFYIRRDFQKCVEMAKNAFRSFSKLENINTRHYWVSLIMIARGLNRLGSHKESIKYTIWALRYVPTMDKKIEGIWTLAKSYAINNEFNKSDYYFNEVINYYKSQNDTFMLARVYNAKAWYFEDIQLAYKALNLLKEVKKEEYTLIKDFDKELQLAIDYTKDTINKISK